MSNATPENTYPTEVENLEANKPNLAGRKASNKTFFGQCARYALFAVHTRFESVEYVVTDADVLDEVTGAPAIIRQGNSVESVMFGFNA